MAKRKSGTLLDALLHSAEPDQPRWKLVPLVLALAFVTRAAVALAGDFVLHPDEIMQYLEPAHRLAFGTGVVYWEYFYGARSWLVPGAVAGVLKLFDAAGLGEPVWYVAGIKLLFCAISVSIPAGMYSFARRHFGETAARLALLAGVFWYELAGFAHKPLTEFVATAPLLALLALCASRAPDRPRVVGPAAVLAVLIAAIRLQYAPVAVVLLAVLFLRTRLKLPLALTAAAALCVVGVFDAVAWNGGLFHSYLTNVRFNLILGEMRTGESPAYQFVWWLTIAGGGLSVLCLAAAVRWPARYGLLLGLIVLVLLAHSVQAHKEYRFIFAVIPLWLLIGADLTARAAAWAAARLPARPGAHLGVTAVAGALVAAVSLAGVLNALPAQGRVYQAWSQETGITGFLRRQDPIFAAYRYLARAPGVEAVWQVDRPYYNTPGYYYLHRAIPFYDAFTGGGINRGLATVTASVSHLVAADPALAVPGYSVQRDFGGVRILRRDAGEPPVRRWQEYAPVIADQLVHDIMLQVDPGAPAPPTNAGIRFAQPEQPATRSEEGQ
ncbi:MAG: hypothetical protein OXC12_14980 [Spirochaetaceae bacterium]|nr:hypothetical protein [Spirochaetaceae bacterium]